MSSATTPSCSQPMSSIINIPAGGKALLRIADLSVTEYATLATLGIPMHVVGYNAKLLPADVLDHQHPGRRQGAAADRRPVGDRVRHLGDARDSDACRRLQRQAAA